MSQPVILQVLPALETGGVERGTVEISEAIAGAGWTSLVASAGGRLVAEIARGGGRHFALPLDRKSPAAILHNAARLARLIRAEGVAIVHARSRAPAWSAWLACRIAGARFVTTYHGAYSEGFPLKRAYNGIMARGEVVIAASRFVAELVARRHHVPPCRIRVIPRGVDPARFDPAGVSAERIARLRAEWRIPGGAPVVLLPGRLTSWKGHRTLIEAAPRLKAHNAHFVLAGAHQGRRAYVAELRALAERLGVRRRMHMPGDCADMPAALMLADVVIHASVQPEAFGRVVIEAQAMARPVIASNLGGPVETVEHGLTGWRFRPGEPGELAAMIDAVLSMPAEERRQVGEAARAAVLARYTTAAMQQATLREYRALLGGSGRSCAAPAQTP